MSRCECCDHPLQHAIREAIDAYENGYPRLPLRVIIENLRARLQDWEFSL